MQPPNDMPPWAKWVTYLVQTVGFPVVVAGYLLWQVNGSLAQLRDTLYSQQQALQSLVRLHGG